MNLRSEDLDLEAIAAARIFWTTGTGLSDEPSRTATLDALEARDGSGVATIHDLDYRPMFWATPSEAGRWQREALARVTVAVGNLEECAVAVGDGSPDDMAHRILELGVQVAVVKQGPDGVSAHTATRRGHRPTRGGPGGERAGRRRRLRWRRLPRAADGLGLGRDHAIRQRRRGIRRRTAGVC